ncbi:CaiB/BaiF CoA-transferase family protein [soil metagenome]
MKPNLESLRVVEVATAISVPLMGAVFANLGADVLKVESRRKLDGNRARVPAKGQATADGLNLDESSPLWHEFNAGKRSVTLNLKSDAGRELFLKLTDQADLFIQNFAPGWLERAGMSVAMLMERNPRLIILSGSGYGQDGPLAQQRVYAPVMTSLGGQEGLIGLADGEVTGAMSIAYGDFNSSYYGLPLLFAALYERETTGKGCHIDLAQVEAVTATLGEALVEYQISGELPEPRGAHSDYRAPHGVFPCEGDDRWATISIGTDAEWSVLVALVGGNATDIAPGIADPRWATKEARLAGAAELEALLSVWTRRFDRQALVAMLQGAGLRSAPVYECNEMETDPHFVERHYTTVVEHPRVGPLDVTSIGWLFDDQTVQPLSYGPGLGEQTSAVLQELAGLTTEEIEILDKEGHLA